MKLKTMLEIKDLHAGIDGKEILKGLTLRVGTGEVHAIMGPNGSGKSTLANVLAGRPKYEVISGTVTYQGKDLLALPAEERAREGVFLAMQYPVEIQGRAEFGAEASGSGRARRDGVPAAGPREDEAR
jgi:Fe-S cluster assembly ATP-binding protein